METFCVEQFLQGFCCAILCSETAKQSISHLLFLEDISTGFLKIRTKLSLHQHSFSEQAVWIPLFFFSHYYSSLVFLFLKKESRARSEHLGPQGLDTVEIKYFFLLLLLLLLTFLMHFTQNKEIFV